MFALRCSVLALCCSDHAWLLYAAACICHCSVLQLAAACQDEQCIQLLLEAQANVNAQDNTGCSALHVAARSRKPRLVRLLLARGADPGLKDAK